MKKKITPIMLLSVMALSPMQLTKAYAQESADFYEPETIIEEEVVVPVRTEASPIYYVALNGLRVRSAPQDNAPVLGMLSLNERVRIVNSGSGNDKFVEVTIVHSSNKIKQSEKYFVAREYIAQTKTDYKEFTGKYFVVVNVATETLRVYERQCLDNSCPNKMIMETEVVVGEDRDLPKEQKGKGRSLLGSYRVTGWAKFYQDAEGHYPAWYKEGYPALPKVGAGAMKWFGKKVMPKDEKGKAHGDMRGAFGWYAGFVGPNAYGQWAHGTIGWGADKDFFIKKTKKFWANVVSNPRSSGCTRNNNEAIAFIRQLVEIGTPMIKIYAREALLDPSLMDYPEETKEWKYILTKTASAKAGREDALKALGITGQEADMYWAATKAKAKLVIDPKSSLHQILEMGTYNIDVRPTPIKYTKGEKLGKIEASVGRKGNVYGIDSTDMSDGVYYVDAGFLEGYHHPKKKLEVSGFMDEETPPWMDFANLMR